MPDIMIYLKSGEWDALSLIEEIFWFRLYFVKDTKKSIFFKYLDV